MIPWYFKLAVLTVLLTINSRSHAKTIRLATGEWAPYQSQTLKHGGFITRAVVDALNEQGYQMELVYMPWKRTMIEAKKGTVDGSFLWGLNEERSKYFLYSDKVITLTNSLFQKSSSPIYWEKVEELNQYKIVGVQGYSYGIEKWEELRFIKLQRVHNPELNYHKLSRGRLDFVIISKNAADASKLVNDFNKGLTKVINDGRFSSYRTASQAGQYEKARTK